MKDANDHFTKFKATVEERKTKALTAAVSMFQATSETSIRAVDKAIASFLGSLHALERGYDENGVPIPPDPNRPYRGPLFLRTTSHDPGFTVSAFWKKGEDRFVEFRSPICATVSEATQNVREWAAENNRYLRCPPKVYFKGDITHAADCTIMNDLRDAATTAVRTLVTAGSRLKHEDDQIVVMLNEALKPLAAYREYKQQFDRRWNTQGEWIGPIAKPKKDKPKSPKVESDNAVTEDAATAVAK